jgi:ribosomal protein L11 methyltransferase
MWETYEPKVTDVIVRMDPGMAFGTGTHETTALCAEFIEKYITKGVRALDVGTGSGILAILASKLGAGSVDALDIDANAVKVAQENCEQNDVNNVVCRQSDLIRSATGKYDFISANIVADIILRMLPDIGAYLAPSAPIILSGIVAERENDIKTAAESFGYSIERIERENDWVAIMIRKRGNR